MRRARTANVFMVLVGALLWAVDAFVLRPPHAATWRPRRGVTMSAATTAGPEPPALDAANAEIKVRFMNTPDNKELITYAKEGENLMKVADKIGLKIPRACCTGLCGTCTSDLMDPTFAWKKGDNKPPGMREGFQTVRACSTVVRLPPGCDEMVVDVYRMKKKKSSSASEEDSNPMERFQGDWELDFRKGSKWGSDGTKDGMSLRQARPDDGLICTTCNGSGKVACFNCGGKGQIVAGSRTMGCYLCKGEGMWYCADCQATGQMRRKKL